MNNQFNKLQKFILCVLAITFIISVTFAGSEIYSYYQASRDVDVAGTITVPIKPGDNIAQKLKDNPAGATYKFAAGIYKNVTISTNAESGDKFIGEPGAILYGAKELSGFSGSGPWTIGNQNDEELKDPPSATQDGWKICQDGYPRCNYNQELFINDVRQKHVGSKGDVKKGESTWFYDYAGNTITIGTDPSNKKVELSVTGVAFHFGFALKDITVQNFIVEKYANPYGQAAITAYGPNATISFNEVRNNHGTGIRVGLSTDPNTGKPKRSLPLPYVINSKVQNNYIHRNGFAGIGGTGTTLLFENNEIAFNNMAHYHTAWDGGGGKISTTDGATFRNNYSHNNVGVGLWTDVNNINTTYEKNILVNNEDHGIQHEISFKATIKDNIFLDNHKAQIYINNSEDVTITNNTMVLNNTEGDWGVSLQNENRGGTGTSFMKRDWILKNITVESNHIYTKTDRARLGGAQGASSTTNPNANPPSDIASALPTIKYNNNTYYTPNAGSKRWTWGQWFTDKTFAEFQNVGQDKTGKVVTSYSMYQVPTVAQWRSTNPVGPQGVIPEIPETPDNPPIVENPYPPEVGTNYFVLQMEHYLNGGQNVSFYDTSSTNQGGATLRNDAVDIKSLSGGGFAIGFFSTGEWLKYKVTVPKTTNYKLKVRSATAVADAKIRVEIDGQTLTIIPVQNTGNYNNFQEYEVGGGNITTGEHEIRIYAEKEYMDIDYIRFEESTSTTVPDPEKKICGKADILDDGFFGIDDFAAFASNYGVEGCEDGSDIRTIGCGSKDLNDDKKIDIIDFGIFASKYGGEDIPGSTGCLPN